MAVKISAATCYMTCDKNEAEKTSLLKTRIQIVLFNIKSSLKSCDEISIKSFLPSFKILARKTKLLDLHCCWLTVPCHLKLLTAVLLQFSMPTSFWRKLTRELGLR